MTLLGAVVLFAGCLCFGASERAVAAEGTPVAGSPSAVGEAYLQSVSALRLQTQIRYLSPEAGLDEEPAEDTRDIDALTRSAPLEWGGTTVLVVGGLLLALLLWLGRGQLADLRGPRDRQFARTSGSAAPELAAAELDRDLIGRLRRESDPRSGLRQVLDRFLKLAAEDNAIVLKRSLTTRELIDRLPGSWVHRGELAVLADRTELVLFGGRDMGAEEYQRCLDLAEPFLRKTRR